MKGIKFICSILVSLVYASLLLGCGSGAPAPDSASEQARLQRAAPGGAGSARRSPAPVAVNHPAYTQLVEQASEHWRDMAAEVAWRVLKAYEDRGDLASRPLYLPPPNNRPFTVAFYHLLRTELVSRGLQVARKQEPQSVLLEYWVQTVPFDSSRHGYSGRFGSAEPSDDEIIVNARMFHSNRFIMHWSQARYINERDLGLYLDPQSFDPQASSIRNVRITGK